MLIDAHHHLWRYSAEQYGWIDDSMPVLRQDFLAAQLREVARANQVDGFVSVQARQSTEETDDLIHIAAGEPLIRGVVGWAPLADPNIAMVVEQWSDQEVLKGLRHVIQDEPDDRFILNADFGRGISLLGGVDLVYDILVYAKQLPAVIEFVDRHAGLPMVLDHIAKPTIAAGKFDKLWETHIRELARRDNVTCKFSGVATEVRGESWSVETIRPYWDVALEAFTPKRLMFGSDWPVCLLKTDYARWLATVRSLAGQLSTDEQQAIFADNAVRTYRLA